ncbi:PREDICTED: zinc finger protein 652-B-like [Branchiostoma belcheri]|uniref:Zinc finger protein 652-B-like n=1 Tax=Branchiostoma belcheri TaxID=7741 RepID=A0A6P4ZPF1_BRABE|nr:PREDICTED: zinc finger protein 652-B-like [Branchiostoma belcheri]XP_019643065.1 PREDICTED: zinc finger protein 652-B-like [Branchiostoma belcheri]
MQANTEVPKMDDSGIPVQAKRKPGRPATLSPLERQQKRKDKFKSRVFLLDTFAEWRDVQKKLQLKSDRELARLLLDRYSSSTQSTRKTLVLERGLLTMWNNIMAAKGFSDDMEFLWFLLTVGAESSSQGWPGVSSTTSMAPGQGAARRTPQKQTSSNKCVPVKVDYVGPGRMVAGPSRQANPESVVPAVAYRPPIRKNSNSTTVTAALAADRRVPAVEGDGHANDGSLTDTDTASESEQHCEGLPVKKENEPDPGNCTKTSSTSQLSFGTADTEEEEEIDRDNHDDANLTSQPSSVTVGPRDMKEEDAFETDLVDYHTNTSNVTCRLGFGTEDNAENSFDDGGNTNLTVAKAGEERVPEDGDYFDEEGEEDFTPSEDDGNGDQSDDSWHPPSERKKITKATKGSADTSNSEDASVEREGKPKKQLVCECGETFDSQSLYYKHKIEAHPRICEICNKKFPTANALNVCRRTHMSDEEKANLSERDSLSFCDLCRTFFSTRKLKKHIRLVHGGLKVRCSSQRDGELEGSNPVFKRRRKSRMKSGDKVPNKVPKKRERVPCTWEGCEKTFAFRRDLTTHLVSHTGKRSHLCSYCGQMFLRLDHLKVHLRIHTGDTPFRCELCSYSGRQSNCLKWHMKTHHPGYCQEPGDGNSAEPTEDTLDTAGDLSDNVKESDLGPVFQPL